MSYASATIGSVIDDVNRTYFLPAIRQCLMRHAAMVPA